MQTILSKRSIFHLKVKKPPLKVYRMQKKPENESEPEETIVNLDRNKPYKNWKDERLHLREKWGEQGRKILPSKSEQTEDLP